MSQRSSIQFNAQTGSLKKDTSTDADKDTAIRGMSESLRRTREGVTNTKSEDLENR